jgi:hypothetical protein
LAGIVTGAIPAVGDVSDVSMPARISPVSQSLAEKFARSIAGAAVEEVGEGVERRAAQAFSMSGSGIVSSRVSRSVPVSVPLPP